MTVDVVQRSLGSTCSEQATSIAQPNEAIPRSDDPDEQTVILDDEEEEISLHGRAIYAVIELGADNKPRYRLDKIQNYLYTASNDVRRSEDGGYYSKKDRRRAASMEPKRDVECSKRCNSTSSSASSGGLRRRLNGAIKVVQRCKEAVQSGIRFREFKDGSSVTSSGSR